MGRTVAPPALAGDTGHDAGCVGNPDRSAMVAGMTGFGASGFPCPGCGQDYHANVTARILDPDGYDVGVRLHCPKCEKVWEYMLHSVPPDERTYQ